jgi:glycosyltransferase involved in cell wall biosynthesis
MRIVFFSDAHQFGGAEEALITVATGLQNSGHQVSLLHSSHNERLIERAAEVRLPSRALNISQPGWRAAYDFKGISRIQRALKQASPEVIVINQPYAEAGLRAIAAIQNLPSHPLSIGYIHLPHPLSTLGTRGAFIRQMLCRHYIRKLDLQIAVSPTCADLAQRTYGARNVAVVWNAVKGDPLLTLDKNAAKESLKLRGGPHIGMIGRLDDFQKRFSLLLQAAPSLLSRFPDAQFIIVGDGPDEESLKNLSRQLGVGDKVHFLGWMKDPRPVLRALDVVAAPSRFEGLPLIAMDALRHRTPVIASNRDGYKDLLPETWRVGNSPDELAIGIGSVLSGRTDSHWDSINRLLAKHGAETTMTMTFEKAITNLLPR